jgi:hypothetical protein
MMRHHRVAPRAALVAAVFVPLTGGAEVYKCAGETKAPIYQEMPCAPGHELRNFQTDPPEITVLPGPVRGSTVPAATGDAARKDARPARETTAGSPAKPSKTDASARRHARAGMTQGEVLAKFGSPDMTGTRKNGKQTRWTWLPADGDPETITTLVLVDGVVTEVERRIMKK